ncbi:MAG: hypothetical protein IPK22_14095 [Verrucomicrobiaceae bacterium]|nr:hypothetical protein [Verrucomicrobiaceae bacterium]
MLFFTTPSHSAVIYSGLQNIAIPFSPTGEVYVNLFTNATSSTAPVDFETSPWLLAFFGGSGIGTGPLVRTVVTGGVIAGAEQTANLTYGSVIDAMSRFSIGDAGFNGSETHTGPALNQFQLGTQGYIGYAFETTGGGSTYFGVMRITVDNTGLGTLHDWSYQNVPGMPISVPEPSRNLLVMLAVATASCRRRRAS